MSKVEVDLSGHSYAFMVPCYEGTFRVETMMALNHTFSQLRTLGVPFSLVMVKGGALIHNVRNALTYRFLNQTECDTAVWIDGDVGWEFEAFQRLAVFSHLYPIIGGCYPSRTLPPTFFVNHKDAKLNEHGLVEVDGTGMGFVAIQRQVYDKMDVLSYHDKAYPTPVKAFYQMGYADPDENGVYRSQGEDIWFFKEARRQGFKTYIDPQIDLTHTGPHTFDAKLRDCIGQILK